MRKRTRTVFLVLLFAVFCGCGKSETLSDFEPTSAEVATPENQERGPLKEIQWSVFQVANESVRIGGFAPYCEGTKPEPRIEKVDQLHRSDRRVLTMFVRFPPKRVGPNAGGCLGVELILRRWVRIGNDLRSTTLFDGSTSPRQQRWPENND